MMPPVSANHPSSSHATFDFPLSDVSSCRTRRNAGSDPRYDNELRACWDTLPAWEKAQAALHAMQIIEMGKSNAQAEQWMDDTIELWKDFAYDRSATPLKPEQAFDRFDLQQRSDIALAYFLLYAFIQDERQAQPEISYDRMFAMIGVLAAQSHDEFAGLIDPNDIYHHHPFEGGGWHARPVDAHWRPAPDFLDNGHEDAQWQDMPHATRALVATCKVLEKSADLRVLEMTPEAIRELLKPFADGSQDWALMRSRIIERLPDCGDTEHHCLSVLDTTGRMLQTMGDVNFAVYEAYASIANALGSSRWNVATFDGANDPEEWSTLPVEEQASAIAYAKLRGEMPLSFEPELVEVHLAERVNDAFQLFVLWKCQEKQGLYPDESEFQALPAVLQRDFSLLCGIMQRLQSDDEQGEDADALINGQPDPGLRGDYAKALQIAKNEDFDTVSPWDIHMPDGWYVDMSHSVGQIIFQWTRDRNLERLPGMTKAPGVIDVKYAVVMAPFRVIGAVVSPWNWWRAATLPYKGIKAVGAVISDYRTPGFWSRLNQRGVGDGSERGTDIPPVPNRALDVPEFTLRRSLIDLMSEIAQQSTVQELWRLAIGQTALIHQPHQNKGNEVVDGKALRQKNRAMFEAARKDNAGYFEKIEGDNLRRVHEAEKAAQVPASTAPLQTLETDTPHSNEFAEHPVSSAAPRLQPFGVQTVGKLFEGGIGAAANTTYNAAVEVGAAVNEGYNRIVDAGAAAFNTANDTVTGAAMAARNAFVEALAGGGQSGPRSNAFDAVPASAMNDPIVVEGNPLTGLTPLQMVRETLLSMYTDLLGNNDDAELKVNHIWNTRHLFAGWNEANQYALRTRMSQLRASERRGLMLCHKLVQFVATQTDTPTPAMLGEQARLINANLASDPNGPGSLQQIQPKDIAAEIRFDNARKFMQTYQAELASRPSLAAWQSICRHTAKPCPAALDQLLSAENVVTPQDVRAVIGNMTIQEKEGFQLFSAVIELQEQQNNQHLTDNADAAVFNQAMLGRMNDATIGALADDLNQQRYASIVFNVLSSPSQVNGGGSVLPIAFNDFSISHVDAMTTADLADSLYLTHVPGLEHLSVDDMQMHIENALLERGEGIYYPLGSASQSIESTLRRLHPDEDIPDLANHTTLIGRFSEEMRQWRAHQRGPLNPAILWVAHFLHKNGTVPTGNSPLEVFDKTAEVIQTLLKESGHGIATGEFVELLEHVNQARYDLRRNGVYALAERGSLSDEELNALARLDSGASRVARSEDGAGQTLTKQQEMTVNNVFYCAKVFKIPVKFFTSLSQTQESQSHKPGAKTNPPMAPEIFEVFSGHQKAGAMLEWMLQQRACLSAEKIDAEVDSMDKYAFRKVRLLETARGRERSHEKTQALLDHDVKTNANARLLSIWVALRAFAARNPEATFEQMNKTANQLWENPPRLKLDNVYFLQLHDAVLEDYHLGQMATHSGSRAKRDAVVQVFHENTEPVPPGVLPFAPFRTPGTKDLKGTLGLYDKASILDALTLNPDLARIYFENGLDDKGFSEVFAHPYLDALNSEQRDVWSETFLPPPAEGDHETIGHNGLYFVNAGGRALTEDDLVENAKSFDPTLDRNRLTADEIRRAVRTWATAKQVHLQFEAKSLGAAIANTLVRHAHLIGEKVTPATVFSSPDKLFDMLHKVLAEDAKGNHTETWGVREELAFRFLAARGVILTGSPDNGEVTGEATDGTTGGTTEVPPFDYGAMTCETETRCRETIDVNQLGAYVEQIAAAEFQNFHFDPREVAYQNLRKFGFTDAEIRQGRTVLWSDLYRKKFDNLLDEYFARADSSGPPNFDMPRGDALLPRVARPDSTGHIQPYHEIVEAQQKYNGEIAERLKPKAKEALRRELKLLTPETIGQRAQQIANDVYKVKTLTEMQHDETKAYLEGLVGWIPGIGAGKGMYDSAKDGQWGAFTWNGFMLGLDFAGVSIIKGGWKTAKFGWYAYKGQAAAQSARWALPPVKTVLENVPLDGVKDLLRTCSWVYRDPSKAPREIIEFVAKSLVFNGNDMPGWAQDLMVRLVTRDDMLAGDGLHLNNSSTAAGKIAEQREKESWVLVNALGRVIDFARNGDENTPAEFSPPMITVDGTPTRLDHRYTVEQCDTVLNRFNATMNDASAPSNEQSAAHFDQTFDITGLDENGQNFVREFAHDLQAASETFRWVVRGMARECAESGSRWRVEFAPARTPPSVDHEGKIIRLPETVSEHFLDYLSTSGEPARQATLHAFSPVTLESIDQITTAFVGERSPTLANSNRGMAIVLSDWISGDLELEMPDRIGFNTTRFNTAEDAAEKIAAVSEKENEWIQGKWSLFLQSADLIGDEVTKTPDSADSAADSSSSRS